MNGVPLKSFETDVMLKRAAKFKFLNIGEAIH